MRILFVTHYSELYGANKSLLDLIDGLKSYPTFTCEVIVSSRGPMIDELLKRKVRVYKTLYTNDVYVEGRKFEFLRVIVKSFLNLLSFAYLSFFLDREQIDIVHTNSSISYLGARLARKWKKKHVWHIREFAYESYNYKYIGGERKCEILMRDSYTIAISNSILTHRLKFMPSMCKIVVNDGVVSEVDIKESHLEAAQDQSIRFGVVGYISETKNQKEALVAFCEFSKKNQKSTLSFAGGGDKDYIYSLKSFIEKQSLGEQVYFKGYISNIMAFYQEIDVLLMCTRNEALGRVTIEALSMGVPVIGYDNAGTAEIIIDGFNGLLYQRDYKSLFEKMEIISNSKTFAEMSKNAQKGVRENYTIEKCASKMMSIYNLMIK